MKLDNYRMVVFNIVALVVVSPVFGQEDAPAKDDAAELAKKLANPIASLISVPLQFNFDHKMGAEDKGHRSLLNVQPVIPFTIDEEWNLISRTIVPLIDQNHMPGNETGVGDVLQSLFFSPKEPTAGVIWGVGPVLSLPTATDDVLGSEKWGAGPTAVALRQDGPWTYGALVNHVWSFAGDDDRNDINNTFMQPFLTYIVKKTKTTFVLNTESSHDWRSDRWSVPVNSMVQQMFKIGDMPMQLGAGPRFWAESPTGGPEGWGFRVQLTFLFPK